MGETTLIDTNKAIRFEELPDGNVALPDGTLRPDRALPDGSTKTSHNDPKSTLNHSKSSETDVLTSKTHSNMPKSTSNGDLDLKTGVLAPKSLSLDAKTSPKSSPDIENSLKLLLSCDSIIRASTKLNKAAPHIYERCTAADGVSISNALTIEYKHKDHPNMAFMYKRSDILSMTSKRDGYT